MFIQVTPFSGWKNPRLVKQHHTEDENDILGALGWIRCDLLEQRGARQLRRNFMSLCYRASGAQIVLRKVGMHHLRGPSGLHYKWYWERETGGRGEEWGEAGDEGRAVWGSADKLFWNTCLVSSFCSFMKVLWRKKRAEFTDVPEMTLFLLLPLPFIYERPVGPWTCKGPSSWIPGRHFVPVASSGSP